MSDRPARRGHGPMGPGPVVGEKAKKTSKGQLRSYLFILQNINLHSYLLLFLQLEVRFSPSLDQRF